MQAKAPGLKRFENIKEVMKELKYKHRETEEFYKDTCEDLERMKIREKFLLNRSVESFGGTPSMYTGLNYTQESALLDDDSSNNS